MQALLIIYLRLAEMEKDLGNYKHYYYISWYVESLRFGEDGR
jgi:hypothetical protein